MTIQFDDHVLDSVRRELSRDGVPVKVEPKVFDLLIYLIENRDRMVSKDDLIAQVWGKRVVSDSALTRAINAARNAIGDDGKTQRLIRTSSRKGYRFVGNIRSQPSEAARYQTGEASSSEPAPPLPDKPSIAILPFHNIGDDPQQEYFADGVVEDIITALSRFKALFVIARNSSFAYKGKATDVKNIGSELGVRYVLQGSVRKAGNRLRITGQLIEAATGAHLWADRFDGSLKDIFKLQDSVTLGTVGVLDQSIASSEITRALRKPTSNLGATDYYYRAFAALRRYTAESVNEAEVLFAKAAVTDPGFAAAYGLATWCHIGRKARGWPRDATAAISDTRRLANLAWSADRDDAYAIGVSGYALAYVAGDLETGKAWLDRSISINPNIASVLAFAGQVSVFYGLYDEAIEHAQRAIRLNPRDPGITTMRTVTAQGYYFSRRFSEAARWALIDLGETPANGAALRIGAASLAMSGAIAQAKEMVARLDHVDPTLRISTLSERMGPRPNGSSDALKLYMEGLRLAGLPE